MIVFRLFLWLVILGVLASPVVAWYGLEDTPMVTESAKVNVRDIQSAKDFLKQYDPRNLPDGKITTITANQGQLNTALAAALPMSFVAWTAAPSLLSVHQIETVCRARWVEYLIIVQLLHKTVVSCTACQHNRNCHSFFL